MSIKIDYTHPIFKSDEYQKDIVPFNLVEALKTTAKLIISDGKSYIICSSMLPLLPAWIWTTDNISEAQFNELFNCFNAFFVTDDQAFFVAKPDIAAKLANRYIQDKYTVVRQIHLESFECPELIPAKNTDVTIEKAAANDLEIIAELCRNFAMDCFGSKTSYENSINEADNFIRTPKAFIIRQHGRTVAMAKATRETEKHISINAVYTLPAYRSKGYAAAIVAHICQLIMAEGKTPLLYTDLSNPCSNRAYTNVGFVQRGRIDEIKLIRS